MDQIKQIDQNQDNNINTQELLDAIKPNGFLSDENNLEEVGKLLNNEELNDGDKELLNSLTNTIDEEINRIIESGKVTEEDINYNNIWKKLLGENDERVQKLEELVNNRNMMQYDEEGFQSLRESLLNEMETTLQSKFNDEIKNLESLGINCKEKLNRKKLLENIKAIEDIEKITENNIKEYINIPENVPHENYIYIATNIKNILKKHLTINPQYRGILTREYATGMTIETTVKNNIYLENLYKDIYNMIETKDENAQLEIIIKKINQGDLSSIQYVHLWISIYLGEKDDNEQYEIIKKIFDNFPPIQANKFFNACEKDNILVTLKDTYIQYRLKKNNYIYEFKGGDGNDCGILNYGKKNELINFYNKGCEFFDNIWTYTESFYGNLKEIGIDETIPIDDIINFINFKSNKDNENITKKQQCENEINNNEDRYYNDGNRVTSSMMGRPGQGQLYHQADNNGIRQRYNKEIMDNCISIEEKYVELLLKSRNKPTGKMLGISGAGIMLDFTKGSNPKNIVRDSFKEQFGDQRDLFVYNLKNDRQAAFGNIVGMLTGIAASAVVGVYTGGNIWASAAAFTAASRLSNGISQELWNAGEWIYQGITGNKIQNGFNQVDEFGVGFLKGVGAYEPIIDKATGQPILDEQGKVQYQFIGGENFISNLAFDYLSGVAMFGAFKALGPGFEAIKSIKIAGKPLEFISKWLLVQNFGIDMPMNALHTGFDVFFNIGEPHQRHHHRDPIYGEIDGEYNEGNENYNNHNLGDALDAMLGNIDEHLSFENQSQVFFNTIVYCGMLEAGQGLVSKVRPYMPELLIKKYEKSSEKFQEAQRNLISEMQMNGLELNKEFKLIDMRTKRPIGLGDPRFLKFTPTLMKLKGILSEHTKATQELIESENVLSREGNNKYSLIRDLGLLSDRQPPLNILKEKIIEAKKQYKNAIESGNLQTAQQLKQLINIYQSAQISLLTTLHPESLNNIRLSNEERIQKAKELLQSYLTPEQAQAILDAHNSPGDAYSLSYKEVMQRAKILFEAGFTEAQVRILMENCICGKMEGIENKIIIKKIEGLKGGEGNALEDIQLLRERIDISICPENIRKIIGDKMKNIEEEIKNGTLSEIDFDPVNGTFRAFGGFEGFIEDLVNRGKLDQNFLNNIKLTIDYMTKRIINVGEAEPITLKEWESRMDIGEDFMKTMEKHMINQWLDNPQYFNSHGFDHTILVHSLIVKVREGLKLSTDTIAKKYGLSQEKANKLYNGLIELSATLHDLGYPTQSQNKREKTTHATSGAELFYKELKPKFEEFITKEIGLDVEVARDLACDMYNAVCFHGADKVECHYVSRVEGMDGKGRLYGGTLVPRSGAITGKDIRGNLDFQDFRISYKSEGFREGAPGRYTGVYDGKLVEFQSINGKDRQIVKREGDKGKLKPLTDVENVSVDDVRSSVQERQNLSRITAFNQAIELSKNWGSDIKIYTKEGGDPVEFKRIVDSEKKEIRFERNVGKNITENAEDFVKENDILKIEGKGENGENHKIELNIENLGKINEQALNQALGWLCNLEIETEKGTIKYNKESGKYTNKDGKEITKEELLSGYKINEIKVEVTEGEKGKSITINDNAYEGRFLNNDGTGLEYRSRDLMDDPLMSMIRIADNLDMAFNRLIPSQSNSIFLTALYNLENGGEIATLFQKMEKFNDRKKGKLKDEQPPTEQEIRELFEKQLNIDIYKIFEEKGHETNEGWENGKKQITKTFDFTKYYKDGIFDLGKFKQDLFNTIRESGVIKTGYSDETLDMSHDLMNEGKVGSCSVRHMVGLRPIENVNFNVDGSVEIKIDMDTYFKSDLSNRVVNEDGKNIRLVEYHLWREGTALKAVPLNGKNIKSYVVDKNGKRIGEINEKGVIDYSLMFKEGTVAVNDNGTFDYSKGIIKSEYDGYKNSPIFKSIRTGEGKKKATKP